MGERDGLVVVLAFSSCWVLWLDEVHHVVVVNCNMASGEWSFAGRDREPNIEIPDAERLSLPPSNVLQGCYANWHDTILGRSVPNLRGRTLEEVK